MVEKESFEKINNCLYSKFKVEKFDVITIVSIEINIFTFD